MIRATLTLMLFAGALQGGQAADQPGRPAKARLLDTSGTTTEVSDLLAVYVGAARYAGTNSESHPALEIQVRRKQGKLDLEAEYITLQFSSMSRLAFAFEPDAGWVVTADMRDGRHYRLHGFSTPVWTKFDETDAAGRMRTREGQIDMVIGSRQLARFEGRAKTGAADTPFSIIWSDVRSIEFQ